MYASTATHGFRGGGSGVGVRRDTAYRGEIYLAFALKEQLANTAVVAAETARLTQAFHVWQESHWQRPTYCSRKSHPAHHGPGRRRSKATQRCPHACGKHRKRTTPVCDTVPDLLGQCVSKGGSCDRLPHKYKVVGRDMAEREGLCSIIVP
jgi:hypothetical protein